LLHQRANKQYIMDDDPMAYLNAKRQEMAEMAAVAQMQCDLAQQVSSRMEKIESLLSAPTTTNSSSNSLSNNEDPEVDYWRNKLVELSEPIPGTESHQTNDLSYSSPRRNKDFQKSSSSKSSSPHSPHIAAVFAHDSSNASRHKLLQPDVAEDKGKRLNFDDISSYKSSSTTNTNNYSTKTSSKQAYDNEENLNPSLSKSSTTSSSYSSASFAKGTDSSPSIQVRTNGEDPEVEYWRRKIAELSANDPSSSSSGYHTSSLPADLSPTLRKATGQPPPTRPNLTNPRYKSHSLADEPLSWEGTASFAAENGRSERKGSPSSSSITSSPKATNSPSSSSSSSSSWRSEMKEMFNGEHEEDIVFESQRK
jgi:hypothetical protein